MAKPNFSTFQATVWDIAALYPFVPIVPVSYPFDSKYARNLTSSSVIVSCPICGRQDKEGAEDARRARNEVGVLALLSGVAPASAMVTGKTQPTKAPILPTAAAIPARRPILSPGPTLLRTRKILDTTVNTNGAEI
jgi:hypothetical protein